MQLVLVGESVDGGSMLRKEQFLAMRNEIVRGLSIELNITDVSGGLKLTPRYLRDRIIFSDEPQFALIEVCILHIDILVEILKKNFFF